MPKRTRQSSPVATARMALHPLRTPNEPVTAREASNDELFRVRNNPDVWVSQNKRITYIREMDDEYLINTIVFIDQRLNEWITNWPDTSVTRARRRKMGQEALKRGLMPRIMVALGDVRGLVKATKELHSKPNFIPKDHDAESE